MTSKTIWVVLRSAVSELPPIQSLILALLENTEFNVALVSSGSADITNDYGERYTEYLMPRGSFHKYASKVAGYVQFRCFSIKVLEGHALNSDLVWYASLDTALALLATPRLKNIPYVLHLHELYDTHPSRLRVIRKFAQGAKLVVVPEKNRAYILQVWLNLKRRPMVVPNKPYHHPRVRKVYPSTNEVKRIIETLPKDKLIVLYQGHISGDRNLLPLAHAVKSTPDVLLILMGRDHGYVKELQAVSPNIVYVGYVSPPQHLEITSYADIGVMIYDPVSLNNLYCAPNKVWEYSGFGIPFIANQLPALEDLECGVCIKDFNVSSYQSALQKIVNDYRVYSESAVSLFDSIDYGGVIRDVVGAALDARFE